MSKNEESWLGASLAWMTRRVTRAPGMTVSLAVAAAVVGLALAGMQLGLRGDRLDLISPQSRYNQRWLDYIHDFGDRDDVVVVVEGNSAGQVTAAIDVLAQRIAAQTVDCQYVLSSIDLTPLQGKALYYLPGDQLADVKQFVDHSMPVVRGEWNWLDLRQQFRRFAENLEQADGNTNGAAAVQLVGHLHRVTQGVLAALDTPGHYVSPWLPLPHTLNQSDVKRHYLLANEGRLGLILLQLAGERHGLVRDSESINRLRKVLADTRRELPDVQIGLTGLPIMEYDEMRLSQRATARAGVLSLVGVACLFIAGFGGLRFPLMTIGALLIALAWTLGYATIAVGHLNILSISFGVILIGLGIDFGIHYIARYLQLRRDMSSSEALESTAASIGPGVLVGAVTTAVAFLAAGLTDFTGVAELGVIAGGGILLCTIAALVVLPALIQIVEGRDGISRIPEPVRVDRWIAPFLRRPVLVLILGVGLTGFLAYGTTRVWYDHNLLNLQADGLDSVRWEQKLIHESDQSVWYAVSLADSRDEVLSRKRRFLQLASVERVEEIASWFPEPDEQKTVIIQSIARQLAILPEHPDHLAVAPVAQLRAEMARCAAAARATGRHATLAALLAELDRRLSTISQRDYYQRVSWFQQQTAGELLSHLGRLQAMASPDPPGREDLPEGLVKRFVGASGRHLIKVFGRGDIWDMDAMERFVLDVRSVDREATGKPLQTYEASRQMQSSYCEAGVYALLAVVVVLLIDFRDLRLVLLAATPLALGTVQLFGLLGYLGIPLNPANLIVLPLILGIGIDDGVHVVHDFRRQKGKPYRLSSSTATAVLMTSLTTIVGFGSLMIASHRGLESLGRVLTLGVTCCMVSSLIMLPALLTWISRTHTPRESAHDPDQDEPVLVKSAAAAGVDSDAAVPAPAASAAAVRVTDRLIEPRRRETGRRRAA